MMANYMTTKHLVIYCGNFTERISMRTFVNTLSIVKDIQLRIMIKDVPAVFNV